MSDLKPLFDNNRRWVAERLLDDPDYFKRLSELQAPKYLWIGCSDSRVPANQIIGLRPGEVFVHRNIANLVVHTDMNALSVIQYAVEYLKIEHIIVCGHYGCGGVKAAYENKELGLLDNWLRNIKDVYHAYNEELDAIPDPKAKMNRLCELNVVEQVSNVCHTTFVQNAWTKGQQLSVHGIIYDIHNGLLQDLSIRVKDAAQIENIYQMMPKKKTA
ncbi:MAG: carbonate dehydratase [Alphaproteobacteria bacterium]|nr:carbonate dehydratase [Alphaproteobacteria bacterium]